MTQKIENDYFQLPDVQWIINEINNEILYQERKTYLNENGVEVKDVVFELRNPKNHGAPSIERQIKILYHLKKKGVIWKIRNLKTDYSDLLEKDKEDPAGAEAIVDIAALSGRPFDVNFAIAKNAKQPVYVLTVKVPAFNTLLQSYKNKPIAISSIKLDDARFVLEINKGMEDEFLFQFKVQSKDKKLEESIEFKVFLRLWDNWNVKKHREKWTSIEDLIQSCGCKNKPALWEQLKRLNEHFKNDRLPIKIESGYGKYRLKIECMQA